MAKSCGMDVVEKPKMPRLIRKSRVQEHKLG